MTSELTESFSQQLRQRSTDPLFEDAAKQARLVFGNPRVKRSDDCIIAGGWILSNLQNFGDIRTKSNVRSPRIFSKEIKLPCDAARSIHLRIIGLPLAQDKPGGVGTTERGSSPAQWSPSLGELPTRWVLQGRL